MHPLQMVDQCCCWRLRREWLRVGITTNFTSCNTTIFCKIIPDFRFWHLNSNIIFCSMGFINESTFNCYLLWILAKMHAGILMAELRMEKANTKWMRNFIDFFLAATCYRGESASENERSEMGFADADEYVNGEFPVNWIVDGGSKKRKTANSHWADNENCKNILSIVFLNTY
jgi:hypothetical protein